jgi:hypothetical protein
MKNQVWVTVSQGAAKVGRPARTVRYWAKKQLVVAYRWGPRCWHIDLTSLRNLAGGKP